MTMEFNPQKEMRKLQKKMNVFDNQRYVGTKINIWRPIVHIRDQDNSIVITFELPGLNKDNINIECTKDNSLVITGEKKSYKSKDQTVPNNSPSDQITSKNNNNNNNNNNIITIGKFIRSYRLPPGTDVSKIKATMDDGLLEIQIPKENLEDRMKIQIQSKL